MDMNDIKQAMDDFVKNEKNKGTEKYDTDLDPANFEERMTSEFLPVQVKKGTFKKQK